MKVACDHDPFKDWRPIGVSSIIVFRKEIYKFKALARTEKKLEKKIPVDEGYAPD